MGIAGHELTSGRCIERLCRFLRSVVRERPASKALASVACRVESRASRSGGMADAADSKSVGRKAVWVRLPPPAPFLRLAAGRHAKSIIQILELRRNAGARGCARHFDVMTPGT